MAAPGGEFDVDHLLARRGTVFLLGAADGLTAPLVAALTGHIARRARPTALTYAEIVAAVASEAWRRQLSARAEEADRRRRQLGAEAAANPPQWAAEALGPVPADPVDRLQWEHRADAVAAWRELAHHTDLEELILQAVEATSPSRA